MSTKQQRPRALEIDPQLQGAAEAATASDVNATATARDQGRAAAPNASADYLILARIDGLRERYRNLIDARLDGIHAFEQELSKRDAPKPSPFWQELVKGLALAALNHVTGNLASTIAKRVADPKQAPFLNGLIASEERAAIAAVQAEVTGPHPGRAGASGAKPSKAEPPLHPDVAFVVAQQAALRKIRVDTADQGLFEVGLACLELERAHAGSGQAAIKAMSEALDAFTQTAMPKQHQATFMAWNSFLAQNDRRIQGADGKGATATGATDLTEVVDAAEYTKDGFLWEAGKIPGLLRLTLRRDHAGKFTVAKAHLSGYGSEIARNAARGLPIGSLRMPIVAEYDDLPSAAAVDAQRGAGGIHRYGFSVGRNEDGTYYAKSHGSEFFDASVGPHVPTQQPTDVARYIFAQLDSQVVEVKG
ncbi:MAG: hypothetical protein IPQ07_45310 [Myxococcales bacterium]|nr:hypothetical protein [Myxococcales bacterium]